MQNVVNAKFLFYEILQNTKQGCLFIRVYKLCPRKVTFLTLINLKSLKI